MRVRPKRVPAGHQSLAMSKAATKIIDKKADDLKVLNKEIALSNKRKETALSKQRKPRVLDPTKKIIMREPSKRITYDRLGVRKQ